MKESPQAGCGQCLVLGKREGDDHVLTAEQACDIVLGLFDGAMRDGTPERFVIQSCELSANGDYWVI